jgi:hypothetical protein
MKILFLHFSSEVPPLLPILLESSNIRTISVLLVFQEFLSQGVSGGRKACQCVSNDGIHVHPNLNIVT